MGLIETINNAFDTEPEKLAVETLNDTAGESGVGVPASEGISHFLSEQDVNISEEEKKKDFGQWKTNTRYMSIASKGNVIFVRMPDSVSYSGEKGYREFIKILETSSEDQKIHISFSNFGGNVDLGTRMIRAMKNCRAKLYTEVDPYAFSMAAYLWSYGDELAFRYGSLMYHTISFGTQGKACYISGQGAATDLYAKEHLEAVLARGLITEEEVTLCLKNGKDLFLSPEVMAPRIAAHNQRDYHKERLQRLGGKQ